MGKSYKEPSRAHRAFWQRLLRLLNDPINAAGNAHKMISPIVRVQEIKKRVGNWGAPSSRFSHTTSSGFVSSHLSYIARGCAPTSLSVFDKGEEEKPQTVWQLTHCAKTCAPIWR